MKKIKTLIGVAKWFQLKIYLGLLIIGIFLESIGLAVLYPLFDILLSGEKIYKHKIIKSIYDLFGIIIKDPRIFAFSLILLIFAVRNFYLLFLSYIKHLFSQKLLAELTRRLYEIYLSKFSVKLNISISNQVKNILTEIPLTLNFIISHIVLISELGILLGVIISLLYIEFYATILTLSTILFISYMLFLFIKIKNLKWSIHREKVDLTLFSIISESLKGKTEINLYNRLDFFTDKIEKLSLDKKDLLTKNNTLSELPRYTLELIAIFGLTIYSYATIINQDQNEIFIPSISIMLVGLFKMLPSANKILSSYNQIKFYQSSFNLVFQTFQKLDSIQKTRIQKKLEIKKEIILRDLHFSYGDKKVLENLNFKIRKGEKIGIKGESGSGKSTFLRLLIGEISIEKGYLYVDNQKTNLESEKWRKNISFVSQNHFLFNGSIFENVSLENGLNSEKLNKIKKLLKKFGLNEFLKKSFQNLEESGSNISGGQAQRVSLVRALFFNRQILIFDEPTSALDSHNQKLFIEVLKELNDKIIIIISHNKELLDNCDKIFEMKNGKLIIDK